MSDLVKLLERLGSDAGLETEYQENPESVLSRYELNDEERKAMLNSDTGAVAKLTGLTGIYMTNGTVKAPD